jgi:predicted MFS family arabinose efflux permease
MRSYVEIVRAPRVAVLIAATLLGRLPFAINALAVLLYAREVTGSFAGAGIVSGGLALGSAFGAPLQGRLVDRRGEGTLLLLAGVHSAALLSIWALGSGDAPVAVLATVAVVGGLAFPPTGSVLRSRWPSLLSDRPDLVRAAYAFDSVLIEVAFISGPLLTALGLALAGPEVMLVVSAALNVSGALLFVAFLPPAPEGFNDGARRGGILGALAAPGIRTMALASLPVGFCLGTLEVALPAFSTSHDVPELAGVLLAIWSVGSAAGGFIYGARPRQRSPVDVHARLAFLLPLACLPLLAGTTPLAMAVLVVFAGVPLAPLIASRNEIVSHIAPSGSVTEAFTWPLTALVGGLSLGTAVAGALVDASGWAAALGAGIAVSALGAGLVVARRATLVPPAAAAPAPA